MGTAEPGLTLGEQPRSLSSVQSGKAGGGGVSEPELGEREPEMGGTSPNWGGVSPNWGRGVSEPFPRSNLIALPQPHTPAQRSDSDGFSRVLTNPLPLHGGPVSPPHPPPPLPNSPPGQILLLGRGFSIKAKHLSSTPEPFRGEEEML